MTCEQPNYEEQKLYYDKKWLKRIRGRLSEEESALLGFITRSIEQMEFKLRPRIIDLGCGRGWITNALSKYGEVIGVDLSIEAARRLYPNLKFQQANIVTEKIEGKCDVVVSSEIIEHLTTQDQHAYVRKAYDLLDESRYLIMTTPNRPQAEALFEALPGTKKDMQPIENWLDKESMISLLYSYFEITYIDSVVFRPLLIRKIRLLNAMYVLCYSYLNLSKLLDNIFCSSRDGLYLTVVARRRRQPQSPE
ncbi:class I SAM-dependent methyltransferase [Chloroflexota bacterium]